VIWPRGQVSSGHRAEVNAWDESTARLSWVGYACPLGAPALRPMAGQHETVQCLYHREGHQGDAQAEAHPHQARVIVTMMLSQSTVGTCLAAVSA
jgi:hypothetical protein